MEQLFKTFNKDFFKSINTITWFDKQGIMGLDHTRNVVITIDDIGSRDHYSGYLIEIFNKHNGLITKKFFRFEDHLEFDHRSDTKQFHVWLNGGNLGWYISRPTDTKSMVKIITDYIEIWK